MVFVGLTHTRIKTLRAEEHLKRLQEAVERFLGHEAIAVSKHDEVKEGVHITRFELNAIPNEIPLLAGEFAYNLRSGLDQLAWQLALLRNRTPASDTAFPIYSERSKQSEQRFRRITRDIPSEAVRVIEALQPYQRGNNFQTHPLWRLNKLCNIDKHVTMPINSTKLLIHSGPADCGVLIRRIELDYGAEFHIPLWAKDKVCFKPRTPELIFGRPTNEPGPSFEIRMVAIVEVYEFVRDSVIPRFELFF